MKPLELTVYPTRQVASGFVRWNGDGTHTDLYTTEWLIDGKWNRFPRAENKRFTDAELAAEWHRTASLEFAAMCDPSAYKAGSQQRAAVQRCTIERFATLPHYDEDQK